MIYNPESRELARPHSAAEVRANKKSNDMTVHSGWVSLLPQEQVWKGDHPGQLWWNPCTVEQNSSHGFMMIHGGSTFSIAMCEASHFGGFWFTSWISWGFCSILLVKPGKPSVLGDQEPLPCETSPITSPTPCRPSRHVPSAGGGKWWAAGKCLDVLQLLGLAPSMEFVSFGHRKASYHTSLIISNYDFCINFGWTVKLQTCTWYNLRIMRTWRGQIRYADIISPRNSWIIQGKWTIMSDFSTVAGDCWFPPVWDVFRLKFLEVGMISMWRGTRNLIKNIQFRFTCIVKKCVSLHPAAISMNFGVNRLIPSII